MNRLYMIRKAFAGLPDLNLTLIALDMISDYIQQIYL